MRMVQVLLALALAGCSVPEEKSDVPRDDFFSENGITEVRYARVAMHDAEPKPVTVLTMSDIPEWKAELLAKANVGSWKREYEDDRVCDGMRWIVEFVRDGQVVKRVDGFNAEPDGLKYLIRAFKPVAGAAGDF